MEALEQDPATAALLRAVTAHVKEYMSHYDASHDFAHIQRVVGLARHLYQHRHQSSSTPELDPLVVVLSALLHDVGDKKYLRPGEDASTLIRDTLASLSCPAPLAARVQAVCAGVSWSTEQKDPARAAALVQEHPELAVVQDADRLDAIGAVGIGRTFAFGAARGRTLEDTLEHFDEKLLRIEGWMKTDEGKRMARERTERLSMFKEWWVEENAVKAADLVG